MSITEANSYGTSELPCRICRLQRLIHTEQVNYLAGYVDYRGWFIRNKWNTLSDMSITQANSYGTSELPCRICRLQRLIHTEQVNYLAGYVDYRGWFKSETNLLFFYIQHVKNSQIPCMLAIWTWRRFEVNKPKRVIHLMLCICCTEKRTLRQTGTPSVPRGVKNNPPVFPILSQMNPARNHKPNIF